MHPPRLADGRERDRFDPIKEGARYRLPPELLQELWDKACADATDSAGRRDEQQARQKFHEFAARLAARRGRLRPDVGKATLTGDGTGASGDNGTAELRPRAPGRETLVSAEARRWTAQNQGPEPAEADAATLDEPRAEADAATAGDAAAPHEADAGGKADDLDAANDPDTIDPDATDPDATGPDGTDDADAARWAETARRVDTAARKVDGVARKVEPRLQAATPRNGAAEAARRAELARKAAAAKSETAKPETVSEARTPSAAGVVNGTPAVEDAGPADADGVDPAMIWRGASGLPSAAPAYLYAPLRSGPRLTPEGVAEDRVNRLFGFGAAAIAPPMDGPAKKPAEPAIDAKATDRRASPDGRVGPDGRDAPETRDARDAHKPDETDAATQPKPGDAMRELWGPAKLVDGVAIGPGLELHGNGQPRLDGKPELPHGRAFDRYGLGLTLEVSPDDPKQRTKLLLDPGLHLVDPKKAAEVLATPLEQDPTRPGQLEVVDPKLPGLALKTKDNVAHDHDRDAKETAQPLRPPGGGHGMARPPIPKPPELDKKLLSNNQAALDGYIAKCEAERAKAKDKVAQQKLAKTVAAQIDAKAIAARVKAANDAKLAKLRADAAHDKVATQQSAQSHQQEGQATLESLKAKLEDKLTADKQKFKEDFELKKQELTLRLQTQKETLAAESKTQIDNLKKQQKARVEDANKRWETEKAGFKKQAEDLMVQMRQQMEADKTKLADQQQKTMKLASDKAAAVEKDANDKADDLIKRGDTKATDTYNRAVTAGNNAYAAAQARAANEEDSTKKSQILAGGSAKKRDCVIKGELSSKDIKAKAAAEAQKTREEGAKQKKKVIDTAANQIKAIDEKINSLKGLAEKRQAENEKALQAKIKAGQDALDKKIGELEKTIEKKQKEADDKIKKLEDDSTKKLQTDYDRAQKQIDQKAEVARQALARGSQKNIAQLEKLVNSTLTSIDRTVTDTQKKFDATISQAEKQAAAVVMTALKAIKAEADKLLHEIDKEYDAQIKAVQDAVAATRKQIDESAKGKMLEIEVHVATMFSDLGDKTRIDAVKKQLRWYVENNQAPPRGFGEVALPAPPEGEKKEPGKPPAPKTPEQLAKEQKAEEERRAALDPEERAKEDADKAKREQAEKDAKDKKPGTKPPEPTNEEIDAKVLELMKKGQTATTGAAEASAKASVKAVYDDGRHAINRVVNQKTAEIENLENGGTDAQVEQHKVDVKAGQEAADKIAAAANREDFWGKDPDKKAILQALEGKTPAQIEALRAALLARNPPINIDDIINNTLSGDEQKEARIRMTGDPIAGDIQGLLGSSGWQPTGNQKTGAVVVGAVIGGPIGAAGAGLLVDAMSGSGVDKARIEEILKRYPDPKDRAKFAEAFEKQTGLKFNDFLAQNIPDAADKYKADKTPEAVEHEKQQAELLKQAQEDKKAGKIDGKKVGDSVNKLRDALDNFHMDGTRADMVAEALKDKSPAEVALIMAEYRKLSGGDLDAKMRTMLSGAALAEAQATLRNDPDQIAVSKLMGSEQSSWTPWTVDDKKMQDTLEGLTDPEQRRRVLAMYKAQTGIDLTDVIKQKMTGNDRKLAECLASGDTLGAAAVKLDEASNGGWLNSMQDAAAQRFGIPKDISKGITNAAIFGVGGLLIPSGTSVTIDGYSVGDGGIHKIDHDQIFKVMESIKDPADRAKLAELYKKATGKDLDADMKAKLGASDPLGSGAKYDAFQALMEGDYDKAAACQAKAALSDGLMNDKEAFYKQLEGKSEWERKRIMAAFNKQYGGGDPAAFRNYYANQLDGLDATKANLLAQGKDDAATGVVKLPPKFELEYAMDSVWVKAAHFIDGGTKSADEFFREHPALRIAVGIATLGQSEILLGEAKAAAWMMSNWGVDDDKVLQVLRENPELAATLDPKLKAEIQYTLSGRPLHEAQYYLDHGVPKTPEEKLKFQISMYQFDRGESNGFSKGFTDLFSVSGKDYDVQYQELLALQAQVDECKKAGLPIPPELAAQVNWTAGMSAATGTQYDSDKSKVANAAATVVGVVVGAVVTVFTGGVGGAILGALLAGVATIGTKAAILGGAYKKGELGVDIVMTAVNAVTAGVLKAEPFKAFCEGLKFLSPGGQQLLNAVIGGAASSALSGMVQTMLTSKDAHDLLGLLGQGLKAGIWAGITGGVNAAASHALDNLLKGLTTKLLGTNATDELGKAFRKPGLIEVMLTNYVSGGGGAMAQMAVEAMADPAVLRGSWDTVLANAMHRFHEGGFQNALQAGAEHLYEARMAAIQKAVAAAKEAQAAGESPEAQREAFAQTMAEAAQAEAAKAGNHVDDKPLAEVPGEMHPPGTAGDEHAGQTGQTGKTGAPDEHGTTGTPDEHAGQTGQTGKTGAPDEHGTTGTPDEHAGQTGKTGAPDEHAGPDGPDKPGPHGDDDAGPIKPDPIVDVDEHTQVTVKDGQVEVSDLPAVKGGPESHPDADGTAVGSRTGGDADAGDGKPSSELTELANKSHVVERANAALEAMPPELRAATEALLGAAENPTQKVLLERAVAAGSSPDELKQLADYMKGYPEAEIVKRFTGADALQFFQESCVPATLQAARAQVDPLYAFKLVMDPVFAAQEQARALQESGGRTAPRKEGEYDKKFNALVEQHPDLKGFLSDPKNFEPGTHGIEPALMKDSPLLKSLEKATGTPYEIHTREGMAWNDTGDAQFKMDAVPHDRIQSALERGLPVPFSANGHESLITDCFTKDGKLYYVIHDPMSGATSSIPAEFLDTLPMLKPTTLMLPAEGQRPGTGPTGGPDTSPPRDTAPDGSSPAAPGDPSQTKVGARSTPDDVKREFPGLGLSDGDAAKLASLSPETRRIAADHMAQGKPVDAAIEQAAQLQRNYSQSTLDNHPALHAPLQQIGDGLRNVGRENLTSVIDRMEALRREGRVRGLEDWIAAAGAQAGDPRAFLDRCGELGAALLAAERLPPGHVLELVPSAPVATGAGSATFTTTSTAGPAPASTPNATLDPVRARFAADPDRAAAFDAWIASVRASGGNVERMVESMDRRPGAIEKAVNSELARMEKLRGQAGQLRDLGNLLDPQLAHTDPVDNITIRYESEKPSNTEIEHAKRVQGMHGEPVTLFGDDVGKVSYPAIDGTIGDPPRPMQLKTFGSNPEPFAARAAAMGALEHAKQFGVRRLEVYMEFDALSMADIERGWNTPAGAAPKPAGPVFDGDAVALIEIKCSDGVLRVRYDSATGNYTFDRI